MKPIFEQDKDLLNLTTFHIPAKAKFFSTYKSVEELKAITLSDEFLQNEVLYL